MLKTLVGQLSAQIPQENIIVINNGEPLPTIPNIRVLRDSVTIPHIYDQWNLGLDYATMQGAWHCLVLNDDVEIPGGFVNDLTHTILAQNVAVAYPDQSGQVRADECRVRKEGGPYTNLEERMTGYAFMVDTSMGRTTPTRRPRFDPTFRWWYGDDDFDRTVRERFNGLAAVGGIPVTHKDPNGWTNRSPELQRQAELDRQRYVWKWGKPPW